jgi:hypothetical protein
VEYAQDGISKRWVQSNKVTLICQDHLAKLSGMDIPEQYQVLGPDELAQRLGYKPATVYSHLSRQRYDKVPPPSRRLAMGPVWYVGDVEEWQRGKPIEL